MPTARSGAAVSRGKDFELAKEPLGRPTVRLSGRAAEVAPELKVRRIALSLTHTAEHGMAFVIED
ncbi:MAG: hypothetical protein JNN08_05485 [Bryobacterales bacterium]|nr:hypothetical protein [Bryobacterales bacterium]